MTCKDSEDWLEMQEKIAKIIPTVPIAIGKRSKASLAHLHNLSKAPLRSYKAAVEDALDSDADDADYIVNDDTGSINDTCSDTEGDDGLNGIRGGFFALEDDLDSVNGSNLEGMDLDDDEEVKIKNDAALLTFSTVPQQAQQTAVAAEKKKWGQRKRPKCYAGNSNRTLQRCALKWRKLESDTFTCGKKQPVYVHKNLIQAMSMWGIGDLVNAHHYPVKQSHLWSLVCNHYGIIDPTLIIPKEIADPEDVPKNEHM
ncbi:hypothetical protein PILCRDRAFT_90531 [Piloderma croceum F 1598]|uniref:Uncharacterized protein n=1 Tax=Piloderma croceum (strain F 1598) TaxID=765440 RepID=A0A0C3FEX0_PILCF|nr:hypothetical protein PILCRDRAFT_90531 [Piloderma croceum F 1598]